MKIVNIHEAKTNLSALLAEVEEKGEKVLIGIKVQKGKLELPARPVDWFTTVLEHTTLRYCRWI